MSDKKWVGANVTYLGKGSYVRVKKFKANRIESIADKSLADYLRSFNFFSVIDLYEKEPVEEKLVEPKQNAKRVKRLKVKGE